MRVLFDLDETLIHSLPIMNFQRGKTFFDPSYHTFSVGGRYTTALRPFAKELVDIAFETFGRDNVFIATKSGQDYALEIACGQFGFSTEKVYDKEDLFYCQRNKITPQPFADGRSLLIDNLHFEANSLKTGVFKIKRKRYIQCKSFDPVMKKFDPEKDLFELLKTAILKRNKI